MRPWIVSAAIPTSCNRRAISSIFLFSSSQPRRVLTVTGVVDRLDDATRHFDHERHVAHHARAGAASGDLLHRASEVDVDDVGAGGLGHARRFGHRFDQVAVDLDADGAFGLRYFEFFERLGRVADQAVRRDEFGVDHIGAELLAHRAERRIGDILHRRQKQRLVAQFQISYFHRRVLYRV